MIERQQRKPTPVEQDRENVRIWIGVVIGCAALAWSIAKLAQWWTS